MPKKVTTLCRKLSEYPQEQETGKHLKAPCLRLRRISEEPEKPVGVMAIFNIINQLPHNVDHFQIMFLASAPMMGFL